MHTSASVLISGIQSMLDSYLWVSSHLIKRKRTVTNKMLRFSILFYFFTSMRTSVLAIPADFNIPHATDRHQRESRSLVDPMLVHISSPGNLTIPTVSFPELNTSSNAGPIVFCHINPPHPARPIWGPTNVVECALLFTVLLATEPPDLPGWQWSPTYPTVLPLTFGNSGSCKVQISATNPRSSDYFQRVMIVQRAALIVNSCVGDLGGTVSVGPREAFQVQVFALPPRATA